MARVVDEELDLSVACDRLVAMANDQGGPDNITVVAARFEGRGLGVARPADQVGYREFSPTQPVDEGIVPPGNAEAVTQPWPAAALVDEERRRRGQLYSRLIVLLGILILAIAAWRIFA